jgi:hypothetical protein
MIQIGCGGSIGRRRTHNYFPGPEKLSTAHDHGFEHLRHNLPREPFMVPPADYVDHIGYVVERPTEWSVHFDARVPQNINHLVLDYAQVPIRFRRNLFLVQVQSGREMRDEHTEAGEGLCGLFTGLFGLAARCIHLVPE